MGKMISFFSVGPSKDLSHYVKSFWAVEGDGSVEFVHKSVAIGTPYIVFHYKGTFDQIKDSSKIEYPLTHVQGQSQKHALFATNKPFGVFGVNLYPYVTPQLFRASSLTLTDQTHDFGSLLGKNSDELKEQIMLAPCNLRRVEIISAFLEKKLLNQRRPKDLAIQEAIKHVANSQQPETIAQLANKFNLCKRQFERKFKEHAGFSPKLYSQISRFQQAYSQCRMGRQSLLEIALEYGYFDQSHFNHEFKTFAGFTPGELIQSENDRTS